MTLLGIQNKALHANVKNNLKSKKKRIFQDFKLDYKSLEIFAKFFVILKIFLNINLSTLVPTNIFYTILELLNDNEKNNLKSRRILHSMQNNLRRKLCFWVEFRTKIYLKPTVKHDLIPPIVGRLLQ